MMWDEVVTSIFVYVFLFVLAWKLSKKSAALIPVLGGITNDKRRRNISCVIGAVLLTFVYASRQQLSWVLILAVIPFAAASTSLTYFVAKRSGSQRISTVGFIVYFAVLLIFSILSIENGTAILSMLALIFCIHVLIRDESIHRVDLGFHIVCNSLFTVLIAYYLHHDHRFALIFHFASLTMPVFLGAVFLLSSYYYKKILSTEYDVGHSYLLSVGSIFIGNFWFFMASLFLYRRNTTAGLVLYALSISFLGMLYLPFEARRLTGQLKLQAMLTNPNSHIQPKRHGSI